jgi:type I restriction enzyme, S subunit
LLWQILYKTNSRNFGTIPKNLFELFFDFVKPAFDQIENLTISNARLAKARDLLLPKLMNGEVAV